MAAASHPASDAFTAWMAALQTRHLADLRIPEVTRALRALSSAYVERRAGIGGGGALAGAGKRAAFALFYAPLHFLATERIVGALDAARPPLTSILDIGCGTGAAGAAWALAAGRIPVNGFDRNPWAVAEARWTYRQFGLDGRARQSDATKLPPPRRGQGLLAAYVLNELEDRDRLRLEEYFLGAADRGARVLVIEPIARAVAPWWDDVVPRFVDRGGRADEWRFAVELAPLLRLLDKAAGLDHREITARSLYCPGAGGE